MHAPLPSQTCPLSSVQGVPFSAGVVPQQPSAQVLTTHFDAWSVQSVAVVHAIAPPSQAGVLPPVPLAWDELLAWEEVLACVLLVCEEVACVLLACVLLVWEVVACVLLAACAPVPDPPVPGHATSCGQFWYASRPRTTLHPATATHAPPTTPSSQAERLRMGR